MKMTEKQFKIAHFLQGRDGKGLNAAKSVLVDGMSQAEAGRKHGVSRQMVFSCMDRLIENYLKALRIKELFEIALADGAEPTAAQKYEIQLQIANNKESKRRKAVHDVMLLGVTPRKAAKTYDVYASDITLGIEQANERYNKAIEVKNMFNNILED